MHLGDTPSSLSEQDYKYLGGQTEGFSGSDVATMVKDVLFEPVRKTQVRSGPPPKLARPPPLTRPPAEAPSLASATAASSRGTPAPFPPTCGLGDPLSAERARHETRR